MRRQLLRVNVLNGKVGEWMDGLEINLCQSRANPQETNEKKDQAIQLLALIVVKEKPGQLQPNKPMNIRY